MIDNLTGLVKRSKNWMMLCLAVLLAQFTFAQEYSDHNWYFGNSSYGIIFNKSDDQPNQTDTQATPFGSAGSAVATDRISGDLLFYTDGDRVYDASHQLMAGWGALIGYTGGNQGVAISPRANFPDEFYIFTNTANYPAPGTVYFSIVDMADPGNATPPEPNLGRMTNLNNSATLPDGIQVNPGMLVFETGNDPYQYFMLVQNAANGDYHLYHIDGTVRTLVKTIPNPTGLVAANFSIHPQSGQIAVSPQNSGFNIQLLQFDLAVDTLGFVQEIPNSANFDGAGQAIYDVEFSPNGNNIYISRFGDAVQEGVLYRYDLNDSTASLDQVNPNPLYRSFGLQIGPDGRIYHLYQENSGGPFQVGRITNPNDTLLSNIVYQSVPTGNEDYNSRQFPSFAPKATVNLNPGFEVVNPTTCERSPTKFYPTFDPPADFYQWSFGDLMSPDSTSNLVAPIHTYSAPGTYNVRLIAGVNGSVDTVYQTVTVQAMQDSIDLGQDTVICPNETLDLDIGTTWDLVRWSIPGETGATVTIDSSDVTGYIWVVATKGTCTAYDGINVEEYGEQVQNANYWYFGNNAGINFNEQPPVAMTDGQLITPSGAATISDQNGDLLFYTDGNIVYDQDHAQMDNGIQIGGENSSTQSSIIIPFPNDETLFYVFTTREVFDAGNEYALEYAVVDIKEIGGGTFGSVVTKEKQLYERSTERLTATNPGGFVWLISHEMGNNTFRAYPITEQGIGNPVLSSIGSVHDANNAEESKGYMKLSADGSRLAVALTKGGMNYVEIFDFDQATGMLSNYLQIEIPTDYPQVYGVEFSSDSEKLFVTTNSPVGSGSKLYELKLYDYDKDSIESRIAELAEETGVNMGAIQTGPDGQIYVARDGEQFLGTITANLDTLTNSTYMTDGFDLVSGTSSLGLPNFVQSYFQQTPQATATVIPACINQPSTFIGQGTSIIDTFLWTFGDGATATTDSATHVYVLDSIYTVSFNVMNRCGLDTTITQYVDISGYPDDATIDPIEILCDGPVVLDADTTNTPGKQFIWSTGEITQAIQVTSPGFFTVQIINAAGCVTEDTTQVLDGRPPVDLGPNMTICQGDSIVLDTGLPMGNPPNIYTWYMDGVVQGNTANIFSINTNNIGTFEYIVNVVDGLTGCIGEDTVLVTINATPTATYTVLNSTCGNPDGRIDVTSPLTNLTAEYFDQTGVSLGTGSSSPLIPAGTYTLVITDNISACSENYVPNIIDDPSAFTIAVGAPTVTCGGSSIDVTIASNPATPFSGGTYTLTNETTQVIYETGSISNGMGTPTVVFNIDSITGGTYTLFIDAFGCTNQQTGIVITDPLTADLTVSPIIDICSSSPNVSAVSNTPGAIYEWSGPNGFTGFGASVPVSESGQYSITVSVNGGIPCDTTAFTQVNLEQSPEPLIEPLTAGCDGTRQVGVGNLTGTNYSYSWVNNGTGQVVSSAPSITIAASTEFLLTVRDQLTGCQGDDLQQVDVYQPLDVVVTVDKQACQDNNMVTLTATVMPVQNVSYEWFLNDVQLRDTLNFVQTFNEGLYRAEATDAATGNCTSSGELLITRAPVTPSNIEPLYIICPEPPANEVALIEPGNFITYLAFNQETGQEIFEAMPGTFEIIEEGEYNFELENEFNCWTLDTTRVEVDCVPIIYAPTAFSPNANMSENQTFRLYPTFVGEFEIFIYNRWGELVFYSDDLNFMTDVGWDGVKDGKSLPLGTYAYVIKFKSITEPERGVLEQPGGVTLIR